MTKYNTCTNCAVDKSACERLQSLRDALKGQSVYSLKFRCTKRQPMFSVGQRVSFKWSMWETDGYESSELPLVFHGTVLRERGTKFVIQVDDGPDASEEGIDAKDVFKRNDALLTAVRPADMTPLDEPILAVCPTCYQIEGLREDRCYRTVGQVWRPKGCIQQGEPTKEAEYEF